MPRAGFEPTISRVRADKESSYDGLDHSATLIDEYCLYLVLILNVTLEHNYELLDLTAKRNTRLFCVFVLRNDVKHCAVTDPLHS
jgi:hypothetical protein